MKTAWQGDETEPTISPEMRDQLRAAYKTIKVETKEFDTETQLKAGNALFKHHTTVVFAMIDSEILLPIPIVERVTIGRKDMEASEPVEVDLSVYGGRERGVSRRHLTLYRTEHTVSLVDLKSTNGTFLNGVKLTPHQPRLLREGDEVRLGNMRFHIYFDE